MAGAGAGPCSDGRLWWTGLLPHWPQVAAMQYLTFCSPLAFVFCLPAQQAETRPADEPVEVVVAVEESAPEPQRVPYLKPAGSYADLPELGFDPMSLLGGGGAAPKPFFGLLASIDRLATAEEPEVMLDLSSGIALNLAQLREVERAMAKLRGAGKRVICYLENATPSTFQVAAQCDHVMMADMGMLDLASPAMSAMLSAHMLSAVL